MLKFMTKERFIQAIDERRFAVQNVKGNKFEVLYIGTHEDGEGVTQYGISRVINPDTKDGYFNQNGGGYNKYHACIEDIAMYINKHAEDKDGNKVNCLEYFQGKQRLNEM